MVSGLTVVAIVVYGLMAFKMVYREPWGRTIGKALGIQVLYALASVPAYASSLPGPRSPDFPGIQASPLTRSSIFVFCSSLNSGLCSRAARSSSLRCIRETACGLIAGAVLSGASTGTPSGPRGPLSPASCGWLTRVSSSRSCRCTLAPPSGTRGLLGSTSPDRRSLGAHGLPCPCPSGAGRPVSSGVDMHTRCRHRPRFTLTWLSSEETNTGRALT